MGVLAGFLWGSGAGFCRITVVSFPLLFYQLFISENVIYGLLRLIRGMRTALTQEGVWTSEVPQVKALS